MESKTPGYRRAGQMLFLSILVTLIAGTFNLGRISPSFNWLDVRLVACYGLIVAFSLWVSGARRYFPPNRPEVKPLGFLFAWAGWMCLSAAWAPPDARVEESLLGFGVLLVLTGMAVYVAKRLQGEDMDMLWIALLVIALVYFAASMVEGPGAQGRYSAFGGGPNVFVRVLVLGGISALVLYLKRGRPSFLVAIPFLAIGAILSGSRGGLLSAGVVTLIGLVPLVRRLGVKRFVWISALAAGGVSVFLLLSGGSVLTVLRERFIQQTLVERYSSGRDGITEQALELFRDNWLVGVGVDGYFGLVGEGSGFEYPHNLFLASAAEGGLIGVALVVAAVAGFGFAVMRRRPLTLNALFAWLCGMYLAVASLFSGDYYDSRMMWFFLALAAVEASRARQEFGVPLNSLRPDGRPAISLRAASPITGR